MIRVTISDTMLRWALDRSGSPELIGGKFPKLDEWLTGERQPTLRQLETFAKATSTPFGYLFLTQPPEERLPIPHFRTIGEESMQPPSPDLLETVHTMQRRQAWMRDYLIEEGYDPLDFIRSVRIEDELESISRKMRASLGFSERWAANQRTWTDALRELRRRMEQVGITVVVNSIVGNNTHRKLDPAEFRGFVLADERAPLVFVNGADGKAAQMFTLAHELAHLWLGRSAAFDLRELQPADDETERACDRIAAEFLIPGAELRNMWPDVRHDPDPYQTIARKFKVSVIVAARRALDLEVISNDEFLDFYHGYQKRERRKSAPSQDGGDFYASQNLRLGQRFAETVIRAARQGKLLYREAYRLTGLRGKTFDRYAEHLGFGRPHD